MKDGSEVNVVNIAFQSSLRLFGQYLNFKCGEQEFQNPWLNGIQMAVASAAAQDIEKISAKINFFTPILFGLATTADDLMLGKGWTSKHYLTDIMSVFGTHQLLEHKMEEVFSTQENVDKEAQKAIQGLSAPFSISLLGLKYLQEWYTGSKGYIDTTRSLQIKVAKSVNNLEYITDGCVNLKSAVATQAIFNESVNIGMKLISKDPLFNTIGNLIISLKSTINMIGNLIISSAYCLGGIEVINKKNNDIIHSPNSLLKISSNDKISNTLNEIERISHEVNQLNFKILMMNNSLNSVNSLNKAFPILNLRSSLGEMLNASDTVEIQKEISDITSYMNKSKQSLISNPRTVIERSGLQYFFDKTKAAQNNLKHLQDELTDNSSRISSIASMNLLDSVIAGSLTFDSEALTNTWVLSSFIQTLPSIEAFTPSLERLTELYKFIENAKNTSYVNYYSHNGSNLQLKDIKIDINGVNKLTLDNLTLEAGKWYLLTGKSGCGKTTFLSTLRGLPNFAESIEIRGDAYYPKLSASDGSKIYMLTQTNNFPYMVNILEALLYPMVTTEAERQSYKPLVENIMLKMEGYTRESIAGQEYLNRGLLSRLDERVNDITSETSGGQQKKMSIAGMIVRIMKETGMLNIYNEGVHSGQSHDAAMEKAKNSVGSVLVLIDETFNGLDSGANGGTFAESSKGLVIKTLKESLPSKAIVLSVEHQPQTTEYDVRLHLNGDGTYTYTGSQATTKIPTEYEQFDPFKQMTDFFERDPIAPYTLKDEM